MDCGAGLAGISGALVEMVSDAQLSAVETLTEGN